MTVVVNSGVGDIETALVDDEVVGGGDVAGGHGDAGAGGHGGEVGGGGTSGDGELGIVEGGGTDVAGGDTVGQGNLHAVGHGAVETIEGAGAGEAPTVGTGNTHDGHVVDGPVVTVGGATTVGGAAEAEVDAILGHQLGRHGEHGVVGGEGVDFNVNAFDVDFAGLPAVADFVVDEATVVVLGVGLGEADLNHQVVVAAGVGVDNRGEAEVGVEVTLAGSLLVVGKEHEAVVGLAGVGSGEHALLDVDQHAGVGILSRVGGAEGCGVRNPEPNVLRQGYGVGRTGDSGVVDYVGSGEDTVHAVSETNGVGRGKGEAVDGVGTFILGEDGSLVVDRGVGNLAGGLQGMLDTGLRCTRSSLGLSVSHGGKHRQTYKHKCFFHCCLNLMIKIIVFQFHL